MTVKLLGAYTLMGTTQNSLIMYLCAYVENIFADIRPQYTGHSDWKRDKTRLQHEIRKHGSQVLTIALPAVGKSLDQALDKGRYLPTGSYLGKTKKAEQVPVFLRDLFVQVFNPSDGMLRSDPNLEALVAIRQLLMGGKKLFLSCTTRRIYDEVRDFYRTESSNRSPSLDWISDDPLSTSDRLSPGAGRIAFSDLLGSGGELVTGITSDGETFFEFTYSGEDPFAQDRDVKSDRRTLCALQSTFDEVFAAMGDFSNEESLLPKHGPGAVSDLKGGMSKYSFRDWPSKLECLYPYDAYAVHDFLCSANIAGPGEWRNREVPSKLIAVPKTQKSPRLIAAEPSQYQWIQQLLKQQLERKVLRSCLNNCITFGDQSFNQQAAILGSLDGSNVTIDLSSASDRLTCWVIERASRSNPTLLDRLHASRTRWVRNSVDGRGFDYLKLRKFSTMGSAVIFPLQSIVYACIAITAVQLTEESKNRRYCSIDDASLQVRVFGDDIVIPKDAYQCMSDLLTDLGLKINVDKTFTGLNFRESCGVDSFRGVNVTPTYLRQVVGDASVGDIPSLLETSNNFWKRGYWHTATWLDSLSSRWDHLIPVVGSRSTQLGRYSFVGSSITHLKKRWDPKTQQEQCRSFSLVRKRNRQRGSARQDLMQWFIENPDPELPWEAGTDQAVVETFRPGWRSTDLYG